MTPTRARSLLVGALVVGVAGNWLLRAPVWRAGFTVWLLLGAGLAAWTVTWRAGDDARERGLLLGGLVCAALGLAWRDSDLLFAVDLLSVLCMGALVIWHGSGMRLAALTVVQSVRAAVLAPLTLVAGGAGAVRAVLGGDVQASARRGTGARAIALGTVLAVPPLFIVAGLLGSSDRVFGAFLDGVGAFLGASGLEQVLTIAVLAWAAAGWLRATAGEASEVRVPEVRTPGVAFLTVSVALYGLVALLTLFLATQVRMLFGGATYLLATAGLTVAEYARSGFFELVIASGVVLGTLIVADWLLAEADLPGRARLCTVGTVLVLLVAALLVSSAVRMGLYVSHFGLTLDRVLAMAVLLWVLVLLVTLALTTLRGRAARFAPTMLVATAAWVALLNVVNPEALVVRVNIARAVAGAPFDVSHHAALSADAVPMLVAQAARLRSTDCEALAGALRATWRTRSIAAAAAGGDWRARDLSVLRAQRWYADGARVACTAGPG